MTFALLRFVVASRYVKTGRGSALQKQVEGRAEAEMQENRQQTAPTPVLSGRLWARYIAKDPVPMAVATSAEVKADQRGLQALYYIMTGVLADDSCPRT